MNIMRSRLYHLWRYASYDYKKFRNGNSSMIVVKNDGDKWHIEVYDRYPVDAKSYQRRVILWRPKQNWVSYLLVLFFFLALLFTLSVSRPLIMTISLVPFCCKALSSNSGDSKIDDDIVNYLSTIVGFLRIDCEIEFLIFRMILLYIQIKIDSMVHTIVMIFSCSEVRPYQIFIQEGFCVFTREKTKDSNYYERSRRMKIVMIKRQIKS